MKKLIVLLGITICLIIFSTNFVLAESSDVFTYEITEDNEIVITGVTDKTVSELDIPSEIDGINVTAIGDYAFKDLKELTTVEIPQTVTDIGKNIFYRCASLENVALPLGLTKIPDGMFYQCSSLETIDIPKTVTEIGEYAFRECTGLKKIKFHEGIETIGGYAFYGCNNLTDVTLPSTLTVVEESLFCDCSKLENINILGDVTEIKEMAFAACVELKNMDLPESVETIGDGTFYGCTKLESIVFSEKLNQIGEQAFNQCKALKEITIKGEDLLVTQGIFLECDNLKEIIIGDGVTLEDNCFSKMESVEKVYIIGTSKSIGQGAFSYCTNLTEVYIISDIIESLPVACFYDCKNLQKVILSDKIKTIDEGAFWGCVNLSEVLYEGTKEQWGKVKVEGYNYSLVNEIVKFEKKFTPGIFLNKINAVLNIGDSLTLVETIFAINATNQDIVWSSSLKSVATVENGVVLAVSAGKATITVKTKDSKYVATCLVTVINEAVDKPVVTSINTVYEMPYTYTDESGLKKTVPSGVAFATVYDQYGNYELKEFGMLLTDKNLDKENFKITTKGIIKGKGETKPNVEGQFGIMFYGNGLEYGKTYYTLSYAIYEDEEGNELTIYGNNVTEFSPKGE